MYRDLGLLTLGLLLVSLLAARASAAPEPVSAEESAAWQRWLIPLPKQISFQGKVTLPAAQVGVRVRSGAGEVEQNAAGELRDLFTEKAGAEPAGSVFEILLGVCGEDGKLDGTPVDGASDLAKLPNPAQAYVIRPVGENRLLLAGRGEAGVYYAAQTLRQLLESRFADGRVTIPLVTVTDWPDLAERGQWGGSANDDIEWMAAHKMNLVESHVTLKMSEDGRGVAEADTDRIRLARLHALKLVPIITHLDHLGRTGLYDIYPECRGKGEKARHAEYDVVAPCFSEPKLWDVLADWMVDLAGHEGVTDICAWLTELALHCECENCQREGQYTLEARAIVKAWRQAREKHPALGLRILLTQGSYSTNDKVLAEVPDGVGVTYYDGGRTYDSSRDPMIYPLLEEYAASGHWLGCYPQLTASWRIVCPWSGPQFVRYRMTEFVDKGLQCLVGYLTPNRLLYDFNFTAAAEWSWNSGGRNERELAAAWATRRGLKDPDAAAEWAVMLGPVGWDVYGSRVPYSAFFGGAAQMVAKRAAPKLGEGMFRYFPTVEHVDEDLGACARALAIAQDLDAPDLLAETRVIQGYVGMIKYIHAIAARVAGKQDLSDEERAALQEDMSRLAMVGLATAQALRDWEASIGQGIGGARFTDTVDVTEKTCLLYTSPSPRDRTRSRMPSSA